MKRVILIAVMVCSLLVNPSFAATTQVDALIEKLVEKGILTKTEAIKLKGEIVQDAQILHQESLKQNIPQWVQDMKIKGDLRVRYQEERRDSTNSQHRGRVRMRLGVETKANDQVKVAVGIATGTGDPRSTNETLENSFEKSDIRFDYAYIKYTPLEWASLMAGKVQGPFWVPKDLIFDSDITFDGASVNLTKKINDMVEVFFNTGFFILDVNATENYDPYMYVVQPGINIKTTPNTSLKLAGAYYAVDTVKGVSRLAHSSSTNTVVSSVYAYDYDPVALGAEFSINNPLGLEQISNLTFLGELVHNPDADEHDDGFLLGMTLGEKKVAGPGQWQLGYNYRRLERNAVLDIFPDSDFYSGQTHVQGHEATLNYGLGKNVSLDLDYYRSAPLGDTEGKLEHILQTDLNFKF